MNGPTTDELSEAAELLELARKRLEGVKGRASVARQIYAARRARDRVFGEDAQDLFGEPAWDMMLELHAAEIERKPLRVNSLCVASGRSATTALRYLVRLEESGFVYRSEEPTDRRCSLLHLTPKGHQVMQEWIDRLPFGQLA